MNKEHLTQAKLLVKFGANINLLNNNQSCPLLLAITNYRLELAFFLLSLDAVNVNLGN